MANAAQKLAKIKKLRQALFDAVRHGAVMYAVGKGGRPIVDQHFTEGNQGRYGWQPLSFEYFKRKQGQIPTKKQASFRGSKLDKNAGFMSRTGEMVGFGVAKNLPMLVNSGELRKTVNSKGHSVRLQGGDAIITFRNLKDYATFLHEGTPKMPKRSPVEPNEQDREQVINHMKAYLARATGASVNVKR